MTEFQKGPGYDWVVTYDVGEGAQTMSIFGVLTVEQAAKEARFSFAMPEDQAMLMILGVVRADLA